MSKNNNLSIIIPCFNEEENIEKCIKSAIKMGAEIFVLDSFSSDKTISKLDKFDVNIYQENWSKFSDKINWAMNNLPIKTEWVMRLDADEIITDDLQSEIKSILNANSIDYDAYAIKRRIIFLQKWIRWGGLYPLWDVRLWRHGKAKLESRELDEHMCIDGKLGKCQNDIVDEDLKSLSVWIDKHNRYSTSEVKEIYKHRALSNNNSNLRFSTKVRRYLRYNLYYLFPGFIRSFMYWFLRYFILLGFLDGKPGLIYHFLHAFWFRFLVDSKLYEKLIKG